MSHVTRVNESCHAYEKSLTRGALMPQRPPAAELHDTR